jgi:hypothetical protein
MAAVAMVVGASDDLQLGFPSAYESRYAAKKLPLRNYPTVVASRPDIMVGNDAQAVWHQLKKRDADYMSNAKVESTILMNKRSNSSAHGYYGMPKAVLGQRIFANPSNGALTSGIARETYDSAPFHLSNAIPAGPGDNTESFRGGVLRSAEGQAYGKQKLMDRIPQLNKIEEERQKFLAEAFFSQEATMPGVRFADSLVNMTVGVPKISDIMVNLQRITDLLMGADIMTHTESGFRSADAIFKETRKVMGAVIGLGPTSNASQLAEVLGFLQRITGLLDATLMPGQTEGPFGDQNANTQAKETFLSLQVIYKDLEEYVRGCVDGADRQPRDRLALSKNLIGSLGISKSMDLASMRSSEALAVASRIGGPQERQEAINIGSNERFSSPSRTRREDSEHGTRPAPSDSNWGDSNRAEFGYRSGDYFPTGGRDVGYFGEEATAYGTMAEPEEESDRPVPNAGELPKLRPTPSMTASAQPAPITAPTPASPPQSLRAYFDPDTQAFNVAPVSATESADVPISNNLAKFGPTTASRSNPASPVPVQSRLESDPSGLASRAPVGAPTSATEIPGTLDRLITYSNDLRRAGVTLANGRPVPEVRGTVYDPGSTGYQTYLRNTRNKLITGFNLR